MTFNFFRFNLRGKGKFWVKNQRNLLILNGFKVFHIDSENSLQFFNNSVGELARIAVLPEEQNRGLGRIIMQYGMDELKRRGFRSIRMLVNRLNIKAIRCYAVFGFKVVGECHMYDQDFLCYEKEL